MYARPNRLGSVYTFVAVSHVQEKVLFVVLLIQLTHSSGGWWDRVVDEEEEGVFCTQMNSFSDKKVKLTN